MYRPFGQVDFLALAVIAAVVLFCVHYAHVDAQVQGSALKHILDSITGAGSLLP